MDIKLISGLHLIQPGKQLRTRQAAMGTDDRMPIVPANGKRCHLQMSGALCQYLFTGSMVNRKIDVNLRDIDISHHPIAIDI